MRVDKRIQRQIFVELINIAAQLDVILIPVKNDAADPRIVFDKLQQVGAILRPDGLKALLLQGGFQFFNRFVFVIDAVGTHDGNDIHAFLLELT